MRGTGPTGPSVNLTKQEVVKVSLNRNGEAREINLEDNSDFIILENGIYKLEYYFLGSISSDMAFFTELLRNGEAIDGTTISKYLVTNTDSDFYGTCVTTLEANDN